MLAWIINLLGGAIGGNLAGGLLKNYNLGTLWNSVVGILGGGIGGQLLSALGLFMGAEGSAMNVGNIIGNVVSSGVGGGVLLVIVGLIKKLFSNK